MMVQQLSCHAIGFIGAGNMAEALIRGLITGRVVTAGQLRVTNRSRRERLQELADRWGVHTFVDKRPTVSGADVVVLAVKPKDADEALQELRTVIEPDQVILSLMAGVNIDYISRRLPFGIPIVRSMPNTSSLVGESATAMAASSYVRSSQLDLCRSLLTAVGRVAVVSEGALDAVTGLSGSGPAYVYLMIEALIQAGQQAGLGLELAQELAIQTVYGAAKMVKDTGENPGDLRHRVMSPGGTTVEGLRVLEERGFVEALSEAVAQAARRSRELGQLLI